MAILQQTKGCVEAELLVRMAVHQIQSILLELPQQPQEAPQRFAWWSKELPPAAP